MSISSAEGPGAQRSDQCEDGAVVVARAATQRDQLTSSDRLPPSQDCVSEGGEEDDGLLFSCRCESARSVATLLSCLRHVSAGSISSGGAAGDGALTQARRSRAELSLSAIDHAGARRSGRVQHATVFANERGLTFHVHGTAKQSQASVDMNVSKYSVLSLCTLFLMSLAVVWLLAVGLWVPIMAYTDVRRILSQFAALTDMSLLSQLIEPIGYQVGLFSDYYVSEQVVPIDVDEDEIQTSSQSQQKEIIKGGEFSINLTTVLECLHVLGTNSLDRIKLCLSYDLNDAIFRIELLEQDSIGANVPGCGGGIVSTCTIPGLSVPDDEDYGVSSLAIAFRSCPIVARAIVKSDFLRDAVVEISDVQGAASVTIGISPGGVDLAAIGFSSECQVSLPHASNAAVFVSLECDPPCLHARTYPIHSVLSAMRGLEIASETCISINKNGMVAIQHQVLDAVGSGQPNFVDFIMGCLLNEDEDDEAHDEVDVSQELELHLMSASQRSADVPSHRQERGEQHVATPASPRKKDAEREELMRRLDGDSGSEDDDTKKSNHDFENSETPPSSGGARFDPLSTEQSSRPNRLQVEMGLGRRERRSRSRVSKAVPQSRSSDEGDRNRETKGRKRPSPTLTREPHSSKKRRDDQDSDGTNGESSDREGYLDVNAKIIASPERDNRRSRYEDEAPSSPELMYGDERLGVSVDRLTNRSKANVSRAFSDDDTDDDFV